MSHSEQTLNPTNLEKQLAVARKEIHNLRQQLITLNKVHRKECDGIYKKLEEWQCSNCKSNQSSQELPDTTVASNNYDFQSKYIGTINTHFPEKRGTPRQPGICNDMIAKLTLSSSVFTNPAHALEGLQEYSHMWIIFHFHRNDSKHVRAKVARPRLNGIRTGVFATRSPHRPSPMGLSLVKIDRIMENTIYFSGVDMVDQTPVLDIKPFIPQYDSPELANLYYPEEIILGNGEDSVVNLTNPRSDSLSNTNESEASTSNITEVNETLENLNVRVMDGEENVRRNHVFGAVATNNNHAISEETFYLRSNSRIGEREAPDGEEEESPRPTQSAVPVPTVHTPEGQIRVPAWIDQPPVPCLIVLFKDRALSQLSQLGPEGEEKKATIKNVLREDPRSVYLRERWGSHCYVFRIAELYVSCKFNDATRSVTVYQVFQNEATAEGDD